MVLLTTVTCVRRPESLLEKRKTVRIKICSISLLGISSWTDQLLWHSEDLLCLLVWALLFQTFSFHIACFQLLEQLVCPACAVQENTSLRFAHKHFLETHNQEKMVTTSCNALVWIDNCSYRKKISHKRPPVCLFAYFWKTNTIMLPFCLCLYICECVVDARSTYSQTPSSIYGFTFYT